MNPINRKTIVFGVMFVLALIFFIIVNPFSWNDAGNRTVVERTTGEQIVQFAPGIFYAGFFSKEKEWPNQISVTYQDASAQLELEDNENKKKKSKSDDIDDLNGKIYLFYVFSL